MKMSYNKLWKLLIDKQMKDKNVTTEVLAKICNELTCDVGDIMEFVPDEEKMC